MTRVNGIIPLKVAICGRMLTAVSALSKMYERQVQHNILDGQYRTIKIPNVQNAGGSLSDGRSNMNIKIISARHMKSINTPSTMRYVKKY